MTIEKNIWADIQDGVTQGLAAAELVNDNKRAVNEIIDVVNGLGTASTMDNASSGNTLGTAATKNVATNAEALAGTADVLPDAAGVHATLNKYGLGGLIPNLNINLGTNLETTFFAASPANGSPIGSTVYGVQFAATALLATRFFGRGSNVYVQSVEAGDVAPPLSLQHSGNGATNAEAVEGTDPTKWMSPARVKQYVDQFGVGNTNSPQMSVNAGTFGVSGSVPWFPGGGFGAGFQARYAPNRRAQIAVRSDSTLHFRWTISDTVLDETTPWREAFHTGNMQPNLSDGLGSPRLMRNVSGGTVTDGATVAGSSLRFCLISNVIAGTNSSVTGSGTWKSVNGVSTANNDYGFFVRIA